MVGKPCMCALFVSLSLRKKAILCAVKAVINVSFDRLAASNKWSSKASSAPLPGGGVIRGVRSKSQNLVG